MTPQHPFVWLSPAAQKRAFLVLLLLALAVMAWMNVFDAHLKTAADPAGIVSFELAGSSALAWDIIESWGEEGQVYAGLSLGLDYLFIVAYSGGIALGCVMGSRSLAQRVKGLAPVGLFLAWAQFAAAALDAVENYALIQVLLGSQRELWPVVARWCAVPKFLLVALGLLYLLAAGSVALGRTLKRQK